MKTDEQTNFYHPDTNEDITKRSANSKPVSWTAVEYMEHQHGIGWYLSLVGTTVGLAAVIYLFTKDYFATGTIVVLGLIVAVYVHRKPQQLSYELSSAGLKAGAKTYSFNLFKSFSILQQGQQLSLSFTPVKRFMPPVSAFFDAKDQEKITNIVGEYLPYEERKTAAVDRLSNRLRL
jgi:hypothetical protein